MTNPPSFLAVIVRAYDGYRGGPRTALREAVQIPNNDLLLVIPAMAAVTKHLGFVATFSTPYEPPFTFARRASTLDHLTKGRFGWNVITFYLPGAARNFGLDDEVDHAQFLTPGALEDFLKHVMPEFQRRGLYRTSYESGTLRERLFGPGHARLPFEHPGARYRGGADLGRAVD